MPKIIDWKSHALFSHLAILLPLETELPWPLMVTQRIEPATASRPQLHLFRQPDLAPLPRAVSEAGLEGFIT